jgi:integrase
MATMAIRHREWTTNKGTKGSAWVVDYYAQTGKRHVKSFQKKKDALAFEAKTRIEVNGKVHVADSETITVAEAGKLWLAACDGLERSTRAQYEQHLRLHIEPFLGKKKLTDITIPAVRTFVDELKANGRSASMVRAVRVSLGSLLSDAQDRGLVIRNAVKDVGRKKGAQRAAARHVEPAQVGVDIPTPAEVKALLAAATGKPRVFLMTAVFTGMRASELRGLRWADVDLDRATVTVRQRADAYQEIGSPKSEKGRRTIPMPPALVDTLREWKPDCPAGKLDLVFPTGTGGIEFHANIVKRWFQPQQVAAGVSVPSDGKDKDGKPVMAPKYSGLHALRHFYASWCINRKEDGGLGLPPKVVQDRMGHATIQITLDTYSHLFPKGDDGSEMADAAALLVG